jgi:hypothetical protein
MINWAFLMCPTDQVLQQASQSQPERMTLELRTCLVTLDENGPRLGPSSTKLERSSPRDGDE